MSLPIRHDAAPGRRMPHGESNSVAQGMMSEPIDRPAPAIAGAPGEGPGSGPSLKPLRPLARQ